MLVDDQPMIVLGLQRTLRRMRTAWDVVLEDSAAAIQHRMEAEPCDVLVTDLNMPGYGGVKLLDWVRENRPGTIRAVLSGHQDKSMILGSTRSAHRFLAKPCDPDTLLDTLCQLVGVVQAFREAPRLLAALAGPGRMPAEAASLEALRQGLADEEAPSRELLPVVEAEPALAAKALQLVNASFFGNAEPTLSLERALEVLDPQILGGIADAPADPDSPAVASLRDRARRAALWARAIVRAEGGAPKAQELAHLGGLLSLAGPMALAGAGLDPAAPEVLGPFHGKLPELSAHYLALLGLPDPLRDLVKRLETPSAWQGGDALVQAAVHVASGHRDEAFLARSGFMQRLSAWADLQKD
jgi:DNA-binding NarL/FixJ family response regulator